MLKNQVVLEVIKNSKAAQLFLSPDVSLGECFDILTEMRHYIVERIKKAEEEERQEGVRLETGDECAPCIPCEN